MTPSLLAVLTLDVRDESKDPLWLSGCQLFGLGAHGSVGQQAAVTGPLWKKCDFYWQREHRECCMVDDEACQGHRGLIPLGSSDLDDHGRIWAAGFCQFPCRRRSISHQLQIRSPDLTDVAPRESRCNLWTDSWQWSCYFTFLQETQMTQRRLRGLWESTDVVWPDVTIR